MNNKEYVEEVCSKCENKLNDKDLCNIRININGNANCVNYKEKSIILNKWNYEKHKYEKYCVPSEWNVKIYTGNMEEIKNKAIAKSMASMNNLYSHKELLELIVEIKKLKDYTEKERNYILAHSTPSKIREMLTYFWLTHTNDIFFNYFGFNWIPPLELREKVQKQINNIDLQNAKIEIPFLKPIDAENVVARNEMLNVANKLMYDYSMLPKELLKNNFVKGATNE